MEVSLHENKTFEKLVYSGKKVSGREFQSCIFQKCDFTESAFSHSKFLDCTFENCNLSMMKLPGSTLNNAVFKDCKVLGVNFSECLDFLFSVSFISCLIDYSSFAGKKMLKTSFIKSSLKEVSFSQTNLSGSVFEQADLNGAVFNRTNLSSASFVSAFGFAIDPELNIVKNASFSVHGLPGLLTKYAIKIV